MHRLHVDHYFCIGSSHARAGEPCEDYALSGTLNDGRIYGIVTDGCSGANARTDLGARVLALAMEAELQHTASLDDCFTQEFVERICQRLQAMPLGGTPQDYLASIVAFCATATTAKLFMAGDGAYATRHPDGTVQITDASWPDNAPYYLGYCLQPAVAAMFAGGSEQHDPSPSVCPELVEASQLLGQRRASGVTLTTHTPGLQASTQTLPTQDFLQGWTTEIDLTNLSALAICSDGIGQLSTLNALDAAIACLAFKNYQGSFVKRRAMKALAQWEKAGHIPQDDFSIAALARVQPQERAP